MNDNMETNLELKLIAQKDGTCAVEVYEPESGEFMRVETDKDNLMETLAGKVAEEIQSWFSIMEDKMEDYEHE